MFHNFKFRNGRLKSEPFQNRNGQPAFSHLAVYGVFERRRAVFRVAFPVGVREGILARRGRAANRRQWPRMQPQGVADVVKAETVGEE